MNPFLKYVGITMGTAVILFSCSDDNDNGGNNPEGETYNTTYKITDVQYKFQIGISPSFHVKVPQGFGLPVDQGR